MLKQFKSVQPKSMTTGKFEDVPLLLKLTTAGAAACVADMVTFPLDVAKVRLQIQGESTRFKAPPRYRGMFQTIATISKEEGTKSLYNGLTAGIQRQMCFASIRIGMYDTVKEFYQRALTDSEENRKKYDIPIRVCAGITTGALSVLAAQPTDVVKIRFQAALPGTVDRYKTTTEAYKSIYKREGFSGLWKGTFPNVTRNAIVNVSEIVCYDLVKEAILRNKLLGDNVYCHFTSGVIAGFCATVVASPVDVIKTRYMNSQPGQYSGAVSSAIKTAKEEGVGAFYKGFLPSFYRLVAWNIVMWVTYEKFKIIVGEVYNNIS